MPSDLTPDNLIGHAPIDFFICQSHIYTFHNKLIFTDRAEKKQEQQLRQLRLQVKYINTLKLIPALRRFEWFVNKGL